MASNASLKDFYNLTKPGIVYGNVFTAAAGFLFACRWHVEVGLLVATLIGIAFVIGSACAFNNYIDRGIDSKMARTKKRGLVTGKVSGPEALIFATFLGAAGFVILALETNLVTVILGIIGLVDYIFLYGVSKRRLAQGTLIGSISGATPIAAGYTAVTGSFDATALILFIILVVWQMPHFYAIALFRYKDYKAAGLPVLPVSKNTALTKKRIMAYMICLIAAVLALHVFGKAGYVYLIVSLALSVAWFDKGYKNYGLEDAKWGRLMFLYSLRVLVGISLAIAFGSLLP